MFSFLLGGILSDVSERGRLESLTEIFEVSETVSFENNDNGLISSVKKTNCVRLIE